MTDRNEKHANMSLASWPARADNGHMSNTNPTHQDRHNDSSFSASTFRQAMGPGYQIAAFTDLDAIAGTSRKHSSTLHAQPIRTQQIRTQQRTTQPVRQTPRLAERRRRLRILDLARRLGERLWRRPAVSFRRASSQFAQSSCGESLPGATFGVCSN